MPTQGPLTDSSLKGGFLHLPADSLPSRKRESAALGSGRARARETGNVGQLMPPGATLNQSAMGCGDILCWVIGETDAKRGLKREML